MKICAIFLKNCAIFLLLILKQALKEHLKGKNIRFFSRDIDIFKSK